MEKTQEYCITDIKISTHPAPLTTSQGGRTSEIPMPCYKINVKTYIKKHTQKTDLKIIFKFLAS